MSRLDRLKEQHPELNLSVMDIIAKLDPTNTYKYTEFLVKKFKEFYSDYDDWSIGLGVEMMGSDNIDVLNEFEKHAKANRITNPDIGQYKDFGQLSNAVDEAEEKLRLKELEKQVIKLYDNEEWSVVIPLSFEASKTYGSNTKWCTTQERYWNDYLKTYKLIYIQNKKTNQKYAVSRHFEDSKKIQAWMADDSETSPMILPLPNEVMSVVICEVNKGETIMELQSKHGISTTKVVPIAKKINSDLFWGEEDGYRSRFEDNIFNPYTNNYRSTTSIGHLPESYDEEHLERIRRLLL